MNRPATQLNVRSPYARERAAALARATGMTTTQVVEEALRAYTPPVAVPPGRLVRRGKLLVMPGGDRIITLEETNAAINASRNER
jgi:Rv0623-like transcription factor